MYKKVIYIYVIKNCKYYGIHFHCDTVCVVNNDWSLTVILNQSRDRA